MVREVDGEPRTPRLGSQEVLLRHVGHCSVCMRWGMVILYAGMYSGLR